MGNIQVNDCFCDNLFSHLDDENPVDKSKETFSKQTITQEIDIETSLNNRDEFMFYGFYLDMEEVSYALNLIVKNVESSLNSSKTKITDAITDTINQIFYDLDSDFNLASNNDEKTEESNDEQKTEESNDEQKKESNHDEKTEESNNDEKKEESNNDKEDLKISLSPEEDFVII